MTSPQSAREYIWKRCEADDTKTDEILSMLTELVGIGRKKTYEHREIHGATEVDARYNAGYNDAIDRIKELMK